MTPFVRLMLMGKPYPSSGGFEAEYEAILNYATTQGYTLPSSGQQNIQNDFMIGLKSSGAFSRSDILYNYATDGDQNYSCINWKSPGNNTTTRTSSPVFTTNQGFNNAPGGSSSLNTNYNAATQGVNYTQNDASQFMWIYSTGTTANIADAAICGIAGNNGNNVFSFNASSHRVNQGTATNSAAAIDFTGTGLMSINRTSSTVLTGFKNLTRTDTTANSAAVASSNSVVLRRSGSGYNQISTKVAMFGMGANMVNENTALYNAMNDYMSAI